MTAFDVAIIGGGVIGGSIAFELAAEKLSVVLLDRQQPGQEASWAAAGMLSPGPDSPEALPLVPLGKKSLQLYPEFVSAVEEASGQPTSFMRVGTLQVFPDSNAEAERERMVAEYGGLGLRIEAISLNDARKLEPSIGPASQAAAWLPEEAVVDPRLLTNAVIAAARHRGVEVRRDSPVTSVLREGSRSNGVVAGGERIAAKFVVMAAGAFSGGIDWLAGYAPTHPVRGQMLALRPKDVQLQKVLRSENGYLVPRSDGRIIAGSTLENAGFDKHVTPSGICQILGAALELVPGLANAEIIETWAGLRPGTPDQLPILGPTDFEGLLIATGHYRNGILLAPVTAKLLREWILHQQVSIDTSAFSPLRFFAEKPHTTGALGASARF
ncbi:MAG: glycine oxidase ThiO [Candidatus Acidiferrales bacterium]